ncbi:calcium-binding protein, RTX family [Candidatus Magnetomorum sp. HK-1]|nr:calcium-binding protein, RTX family [Candidatus Magnetomorum sp. HK-1]
MYSSPLSDTPDNKKRQANRESYQIISSQDSQHLKLRQDITAKPNGKIFLNLSDAVKHKFLKAKHKKIKYAFTVLPLNGKISGTSPNIIYTPDKNYLGQEMISFIIGDEEKNILTTATINIDINIDDGSDKKYKDAKPAKPAKPGELTQGKNIRFRKNFDKQSVSMDLASTFTSARTKRSRSYICYNNSTITSGTTLSINEDSCINITLNTAPDVNYAIKKLPENGKLLGTPPNLKYIPDVNFSGSDNFQFIAKGAFPKSRTILPLMFFLKKLAFSTSPTFLT